MIKRMSYGLWAALTLVFSILPYAWDRFPLTNKAEVFGFFAANAAFWLLSFSRTMILGGRGWRRWWPIITVPVSLFPAAQLLFVLYCWRTHGFAP